MEIGKKDDVDLLTYSIDFFFYKEVSVSRFVHSHQSSIAEETGNFPKKFRHLSSFLPPFGRKLQSTHNPKISPLLRRERLCSRRLEGKVVENKCRFAFRSRVSLSLSFEFEDPSIFLPSRSLKKYYGEERNTELKLKR